MAITNSNASVSDKPPKGVMIPRAAGAPSADEKAYAVSMNQVARQ
jgi:hypothetical protein